MSMLLYNYKYYILYYYIIIILMCTNVYI
jgi:hypothetical protein